MTEKPAPDVVDAIADALADMRRHVYPTPDRPDSSYAKWERANKALAALQARPDAVEAAASRIAASQGLNWDEVCGYERPEPDNDGCDSPTCVAAHFEDHDPDWARRQYRIMAAAALQARPGVALAGELEALASGDAANLSELGLFVTRNLTVILSALRTHDDTLEDAAKVAQDAIDLLWEHCEGLAPRIEHLEDRLAGRQ